MLIQFSIKNFRSFKDRSTLSLVASNYDKKTRSEENIIEVDKFKLRLLKSAVIYGANAGGKSKFIESMMFMRDLVLNSSKDTQKGESLSVEPFRLDSETANLGSEFEVVFMLKNDLYRYGFEVNSKVIISEWLYHKPKTKETELFYRDYQNISANSKKHDKANTIINQRMVRDNALFLSVLAQFNDPLAELILDWFKTLKTISGLKEEGYLIDSMELASDSIHKERILMLLKNADLGIDDFRLKKLSLDDSEIDSMSKEIPDEIKEIFKGFNSFLRKKIKEENRDLPFSDVITIHKQFDSKGVFVKDVEFSMLEDESSGTRKFFALIGQLIKIIDSGHVLFADELDSKLHPNLVCKIVSIFNSKLLNPNNAQLIFNTHDTNLLGSGLFRRDQIWFTKKDNYGATSLYSLAEFKTDSVRKNEAFEDNYIRGKYGAIPILGDFENYPKKNMGRDENAR
jgi:AAA15 family ATPase/GTPase